MYNDFYTQFVLCFQLKGGKEHEDWYWSHLFVEVSMLHIRLCNYM